MTPRKVENIALKHSALDPLEVEVVSKVAEIYESLEGEYVDQFETSLAAWAGFEWAVVGSSETGAASVMAGALELKPGDEVIVSPAIASWLLSALIHAGIVPVFADFASGQFMVAAEAVEKNLGKRTRGILISFPFGHPEDISAIHTIAQDVGLPLIVEVTESLGSSLGTKSVYRYADIAILSLREEDSALSTGEGGVLFIRDAPTAKKAKSYARFSDLDGMNHGINQKLSEVQCALGLYRLGGLDVQLDNRQRILTDLADRMTRNGIAIKGLADGCKRGKFIVAHKGQSLEAFGAQVRQLTLAVNLPVIRDYPVADCPEAHSMAREWCGVIPIPQEIIL